MTEAFRYNILVTETLRYRIYDNDILRVLSRIFFYAGIVSVYALWEKSRPTIIIILLIIFIALPGIISKILNLIIDNQIDNNNYALLQSLAYSVSTVMISLVCIIARWITIAKLYTNADKEAKLILTMYMIIFAIGLAASSMIFYFAWSVSQAINMAYPYIYKAANILLYVLIIIYLKRKLGELMPFTKAFRFAKKECTNHPPEDD